MQYFILRDGTKAGPFAQYDIMSLIREGDITVDTLLWKKGMAQWDEARNFPELESWFASAKSGEARPDKQETTSPLDHFEEPLEPEPDLSGASEASAPPRPAFSVVPPIVNLDPFAPRIFRRLLARVFDVVFYTTLFMGGLLLFYGDAAKTFALMMSAQGNIASYLLFALIETFLLAKTGFTPGKYILGMKVVNPANGIPSLAESMSRSFLVSVRGMALGVVLFLPITITLLVLDWKKTGLAYWDRVNGLRVYHAPISDWRIPVVAILLVAMFGLWGAMFGESAKLMIESGMAPANN